MAKTIRFFFFSLLILFFLNGCNTNNANVDKFEFKGSYIGDNSAVESIVKQLPNGEHFKGFELKTKEEPYGMILNYEGIEAEEIEKRYKETAIYNATFIFALVQNAEWVTFNFKHQEYQLTIENLQGWYGKELSEYSSEDELRKLSQEYLEDENKVYDLLK
ncbi:hypothetical protein J2S78_000488 [Salibacterium salarium]|uniref:DUF4825 domain-containing protein n=1 Tax=Salibacterium salarium TaxID=284579 RepID=UPI0027855CA0|nr:DUF4825 domain-containing protein [Salibacterium salarium]MDQ0298080.1 hypothetical protein [Salibacterium salarium]